MKWRNRQIILILLLTCSLCYGQMDHYQFKRLITGVNDQWHRVPLPDSIFGKVSRDLSDLRIYGLGNNNDTIEVPYLLRINSKKINSRAITFKTLNTSYNNNGYYYTFEVPAAVSINQIDLNFKERNFDWNIDLQGSWQQEEWFTLVNDYRILSIKNELTDYEFTTVILPNSKYRFFRLHIKSDKKPNLISAQIFDNESTDGEYKKYPINEVMIDGNRAKNTTEIIVDLAKPIPVGSISFGVREQYDFYRPIAISHIIDSVKTDKGWKYNYNTLLKGTLSSLEESSFDFPSTIVQKIKITVYNGDNQPLTYENFQVKGFLHELVARFTKEGTYYLTYGNSEGSFPNYDIAQFSKNIPETLAPVKVGSEQRLRNLQFLEQEPIFKNKLWLWAIIAIIIMVLGGFSLNMIKNRD
mgnify:CR=1 FL=1